MSTVDALTAGRRKEAAGMLAVMFPAAHPRYRATRSWALVTMKLITAGFLLVAIAVVLTTGQHDTDAGPARSTVVVSAGANDPAIANDGSFTEAVGATWGALTIVCVFLIVCGVLLVAATFRLRRGSVRDLAIAPHGSPSPFARKLTFRLSLSLFQLSISRT